MQVSPFFKFLHKIHFFRFQTRPISVGGPDGLDARRHGQGQRGLALLKVIQKLSTYRILFLQIISGFMCFLVKRTLKEFYVDDIQKM